MILVTGATGTVGSEAVQLLSARHQPARALVRDPDRVTNRTDLADEIEIVTGDFDRPDTLDAALHGVDTVVLVSPAVPAQEIAVIDSAVRQGVSHIVKITSKASADSRSTGGVDRRGSRRTSRPPAWRTRCCARTRTCRICSRWPR